MLTLWLPPGNHSNLVTGYAAIAIFYFYFLIYNIVFGNHQYHISNHPLIKCHIEINILLHTI